MVLDFNLKLCWPRFLATVIGLTLLAVFHTLITAVGYLKVLRNPPQFWLICINIGCCIVPGLCYLLAPMVKRKTDWDWDSGIVQRWHLLRMTISSRLCFKTRITVTDGGNLLKWIHTSSILEAAFFFRLPSLLCRDVSSILVLELSSITVQYTIPITSVHWSISYAC